MRNLTIHNIQKTLCPLLSVLSVPSVDFERPYSFRYRSEALNECGFNLDVLRSKSLLASIPKLFSQGTKGSKNQKYESLITVNYKYKEVPVLLSWM